MKKQRVRKWKVEVELWDYSNANFFTRKEIRSFVIYPHFLELNMGTTDGVDCIKAKNLKIKRKNK